MQDEEEGIDIGQSRPCKMKNKASPELIIQDEEEGIDKGQNRSCKMKSKAST